MYHGNVSFVENCRRSRSAVTRSMRRRANERPLRAALAGSSRPLAALPLSEEQTFNDSDERRSTGDEADAWTPVPLQG